jgi:predicted peptidase
MRSGLSFCFYTAKAEAVMMELRKRLGAWAQRYAKNPKQYPCLVVMPQCRENHSWGDPKMEMRVFTSLEQTLKEFNVDAERMYLTGLSAGANATWYFAARYPGKFAAVVPMAGASRRVVR